MQTDHQHPILASMTKMEERMFTLDLAIVQLIAGILVTLGSALFAISIRFGLTIPAAMQDAIFQMLVKTELSQELQNILVQESLINYVFVLAAIGMVLIISGIVFASTKIKKLRQQILYSNEINSLIETDVNTGPKKKESRPDLNESSPSQTIPKKEELIVENADSHHSTIKPAPADHAHYG